MSQMEPRHRTRASDEERDYVLHLLQQAHGAGRIDIEEFDDRQDKAFSAKYTDEFVPLLEDLPEGRDVVAVLRPKQPEHPMRRPGPASFLAPSQGGQQSIAILSGKDIFISPGSTSFHSMAFLGGDNVDLTAVMGPGVVFVLVAQSVLGGSTVRVPAGVHIVDESTAVLGGNSIRKRARGDGSNGTLILRGICILGGCEVKLA